MWRGSSEFIFEQTLPTLHQEEIGLQRKMSNIPPQRGVTQNDAMQLS